jgi:hypothetical protein
MRNRLSQTVLAATAIAALAVPVGAQARQGADDPAGHVRHAPHQTAPAPAPAAAAPATATPAAQKSTSSRSRNRHRGRHGRRHGRNHVRRADDRTQIRGRGADDATAERRGRGTDDGPNHS